MNEPYYDFSGASLSNRTRLELFHPFTRDLFGNGSKRDRLRKWTHLGMASSSIWTGSSGSRANNRLEPFGYGVNARLETFEYGFKCNRSRVNAA